MTRITALCRLLVALALVPVAGASWAQQPFPSKPVRLIVPFPPGGTTNVAARLVADKLSERWGQPVIVDSRPGANGVIASTELVNARPDGYTLLFDVNQHAINPAVMRNLPYDTTKDFTPVGAVYRFELILVANPGVPAQTLQEFIALAKASPGKYNYATADTNGLTHLASAAFTQAAGIQLEQIAYKGTGPALVDLLGGQVQMLMTAPAAVIQHVQAGKLKALAWTGKTRSRIFPNVPTFAEAGLPNLDASSWGGVFAPAGTPSEIVNKISVDLAAVLASPDVREKLAASSLEPFSLGPAEFSALIRGDLTKYARLVKEANLKVE